ncbi:MAG: sigma-70 family RNA polymerase sigma factor [Pirellulaceae bacterium]|nr:sigma-70 family RNA polymerase sigma factor [Pirellulaceae bacterium]
MQASQTSSVNRTLPSDTSPSECPNPVDFERLIAEVRNGSQDAAWNLIEQYSPKIFRVVRRKLPDVLRQKFDSQDFVQAAWASVFAHRSRLDRLASPEEFIAFMAAVASNKVGVEVRRRLASKKYDVRRERSLADSASENSDLKRASDPTPSQVAVARERWSQIMAEQPQHYRQIIELRYAGVTFREIAEQLGYDESTVRRAVRKIFEDQQL